MNHAANQSIIGRAFARAGLVGNPSDGYFGKTISFTIRNFSAQVTLTPSEAFEIHPGPGDFCRFDSVDAFVRETKLTGYYGAMRLVKAAVVRFFHACEQHRVALPDRRPFSLTCETDIPRLVGLSGSSAFVTATLRALMGYYEVWLPMEQLPTIALEAESKELGIAAGLQDRVVQAYEGLVYMNFERERVERTGAGLYERLQPRKWPRVYVAWDADRAEVSDVPHRNLRQAWERGEQDVHDAMAELAEITDDGRTAIEAFDMETLHRVTNRNFDIRRRIMPIAPENLRMVEMARQTGASAKFAGSGGAITGVYLDDAQYEKLVDALATINCRVIKPRLAPEAEPENAKTQRPEQRGLGSDCNNQDRMAPLPPNYQPPTPPTSFSSLLSLCDFVSLRSLVGGTAR